MPDATLADYSALVHKVHMSNYPLLPEPDWGQDAAYLAFIIDGMVKRIEELQVDRKTYMGKADWQWDEELQMHIPCCTKNRSKSGPPCGNGPLNDDQIAEGDCGEHG